MEVSPAKSLILSATIHGGSYFFIQPRFCEHCEFVKSSLYTFPICVTLPFQANTTPHGGSVHGAF